MSIHVKSFLSHIIAPNTTWQRHLITQWPTIVGDLHDKMQLIQVKGNMLIIGVYDTSWLQELHLLSNLLIKTINTNLEQPYVQKIHFRNTPKSNPRIRENAIKYRQTAPKSIILNKEQQQALDPIENDELRAALKRYLIRCMQEKS